MWPFKKKYTVDYTSLISKLETANEYDIQNLLWQPPAGSVKYLPDTIKLVQRLKRLGSAKGLSIYQHMDGGNFELIIFNVPWDTSGKPFSPLIIDKKNGKIAGLMLPFNELYAYLSKADSDAIAELATRWVRFIMNV